MVKAVVMPKLGQSEETVKIVKWRKQLGDTVAKGDILFEIETDKAVLEVESFYEGTLLKIVAGRGSDRPRANHRGFCRRSRRAGSGSCARLPHPGPKPASRSGRLHPHLRLARKRRHPRHFREGENPLHFPRGLPHSPLPSPSCFGSVPAQ